MSSGWVLADLLTSDNENQVKMYKKYCFGYITSLKQSDLYQSEKQDPDLNQSEKQDPDPYQNGLDPQLWTVGRLVDWWEGKYEYGQAAGQMGRQTDKQTDRQTDR
jgi:hypothetical protein